MATVKPRRTRPPMGKLNGPTLLLMRGSFLAQGLRGAGLSPALIHSFAPPQKRRASDICRACTVRLRSIRAKRSDVQVVGARLFRCRPESLQVFPPFKTVVPRARVYGSLHLFKCPHLNLPHAARVTRHIVQRVAPALPGFLTIAGLPVCRAREGLTRQGRQ